MGQDLKRAEELTADRMGKADCCQERGAILQKQRNYRLATVEFEVPPPPSPPAPAAAVPPPPSPPALAAVPASGSRLQL